MALFNVLFDIAARTANIEAGFTRIERRFDSIGGYAKRAAGLMGVAFGANMFQQGIASAIELGDEMGKLAEKTGLTASAASSLSRVFQQNDLTNEQLSTSMKKMQVELSKGADIFAQLGLSATDLKNKSADKAFEDIAEAISRIADPADRARAAVEIFGKSGSDLLPILLQGKQGIQALRKELGNMSDEDVAKMQKLDDQIKKMQFLKQDFWNALASASAKFLESVNLIDKDKIGELKDQLALANKELSKVSGGEGTLFDVAAYDKALAKVEELETAINRARTGFGTGTRGGGPFKPTEGSLLDPVAQEKIQKSSESLEFVAVTAERGKNATYEWVLAQAQLNEEFANLKDGPLDYVRVTAEGPLSEYQQQIARETEAIKARMKDMNDEINPYFQEMGRSMTAAFSDAFYNIGTGANNFAGDIINAFKRVLANKATEELFGLLASWGSSASSSGGWMGAVGSFFGSVFGGSRDSGGRGEAGKGYLIGKGAQPEMFWPDSAGTFIPNAATGGGMTYAPVMNINIGANNAVSRSEVMEAVHSASRATYAQVSADYKTKRGGFR